MERIVRPCKPPPSTSRHSTERSRLSERIVAYFMDSEAVAATINWNLTKFDQWSLYKGLYNVSQKDRWRGRLSVCLHEGDIVLKRLKDEPNDE